MHRIDRAAPWQEARQAFRGAPSIKLSDETLA